MEIRRIPDWDGTKESAELYHHGIKGQRWGKRNYQNTDGTLTQAGKLRYAKGGKPISTNSAYEENSRRGKAYQDEYLTRRIKTAYSVPKTFTKEDYRQVRWNTHKDKAYGDPIMVMGRYYTGTDDEITNDKRMSERFGKNWQQKIANGTGDVITGDKIYYETNKEEYDKALKIKADKEAAEKRTKEYKHLAGESKFKAMVTRHNNKLLSVKAKRFADSFKEVHMENINKTKKGFKKAATAVKNYFNLKMP